MLFINYVRKCILVAVISIAATNMSFGQYYHSPNDTIISNANFDDGNVYNITQVHTSNDTITFKYYKHSTILPLTWDALLCDNATCHPDLIDSSVMVAIPGDNGLMSLHLNPHFEAGTGIVRYLISATATPLQIDTLTWIISAGSTGLISNMEEGDPSISFSKGKLIVKNVKQRFKTIQIFDIAGRQIFSGQFNIGNESYVLSQPVPSLVIVRLSGPGIVFNQKLSTK